MSSRQWMVLPLVLFFLVAHSMNGHALTSYQLATGHPTGSTYGLGVGIASLVKVKILPSVGIDLNTVITKGNDASLEALRDQQVEFALIDIEQGRAPRLRNVNAVATLRRQGAQSTTLLARADIDPQIVYVVIKAIFDHLPFLASIDPDIAEISLDEALLGLEMPLHAGAKRYYADRWGTGANPPPTAVQAEPAPDGPTIVPPSLTVFNSSDAESFVVYFGFNDDSLDTLSVETVERAMIFAKSLDDPAILIAAYTDAVGDADYNYLLAERRAKAVVDGLTKETFQYSELEVELYGERELPQVTLDDVTSANNRRVEIFIERPLRTLQPLPLLPKEVEASGDGRGGPIAPAPSADITPVSAPDRAVPLLKPTSLAPSAPPKTPTM